MLQTAKPMDLERCARRVTVDKALQAYLFVTCGYIISVLFVLRIGYQPPFYCPTPGKHILFFDDVSNALELCTVYCSSKACEQIDIFIIVWVSVAICITQFFLVTVCQLNCLFEGDQQFLHQYVINTKLKKFSYWMIYLFFGFCMLYFTLTGTVWMISGVFRLNYVVKIFVAFFTFLSDLVAISSLHLLLRTHDEDRIRKEKNTRQEHLSQSKV